MIRGSLFLLAALLLFSTQGLAATEFLLPQTEPSQENAPSQVYEISPGTTLKQGLQQWSVTTGCTPGGGGHWQIIWESDVNYRVDAPLTFHGDYLTAITKVIDLYSVARIPLYAHIHRNQCLVVIDTR